MDAFAERSATARNDSPGADNGTGNNVKGKRARLRAVDYRHYIAIAITLGFLACGIVFCNSIPRLGEAFRDIWNSGGFYLRAIADRTDENAVATVTTMPAWQFRPSSFAPLEFFPWTWEEFKVLCSEFTSALFSGENLRNWWWVVTDVLYYVSKGFLVLMPVVLLVVMLGRRYTSTTNNDNDRDSLPLTIWKGFVFSTVYPVKGWLCRFIAFLRENDRYHKTWIFLWLLYFNVFAIIVEFIAFYLYLIVSYDFVGIYGQVVKLMYDLAPAVRFIPGVVWVCLALWIFDYFCRKAAYDRLYAREESNERFVEDRGVVTIVYGPMGVGKTSLLTSLSLTAEVKIRNDAFEILLERDMMFPMFPWCQLRSEIRAAAERREIVDIDSCKSWARRWESWYHWVTEDKTVRRSWAKYCKRHPFRYDNMAFGYDVDHYPMTYEGELGTVTLWDAIEDYVSAYFIFTIQTSLIISNYSIRTDQIMADLGNMPLWDSDFFRRDARLMEAYSKYAHIIDFDMLRLGKRMLAENPNRNAFGFGVYVVSEIDKERKNALELRETKKNTEECNQMNDLFNACLKMSRHACVIANRVFLKIFCDLQRPEDWGAGGREVGEIVYIAEKGDMMPTLPFVSTYWWTSSVFGWARRKFDRFYTQYIHVRSDNTLFVHLLKGIMARMTKHYQDIEDLFGSQTLHLECESGRMDGDVRKCKFYRMPKKDYSRRYSTNCLSAIFVGDVPNRVSINDFVCYAGVMATAEELKLQNSHFQRDLEKRKQQYAA